jgi:hypothetical protein
MKNWLMLGLVYGLFGIMVACEEQEEPEGVLIGGVIANETEDDVTDLLELGQAYRDRLNAAVDALLGGTGALEMVDAYDTLSKAELEILVEDASPVVPWYDTTAMQALDGPWGLIETVLEENGDLVEGDYVTLDEDVYHNAYTLFYVVDGDALYVELYWDKLDTGDDEEPTENLLSVVLFMDVIDDQVVVEMRKVDTYGETWLRLTEEEEMVLYYEDAEETMNTYHYVHLGTKDRMSIFETSGFVQYDAFDGESEMYYQVQFRLSDGDKGSELYAQYDEQGVIWSVQLVDPVGRYILTYRLSELLGWEYITFLEDFTPSTSRSFLAYLTEGDQVVDLGDFQEELWLLGVPVLTIRMDLPELTEQEYTLSFSDLTFDALSFAAFTEHRNEVDRAFLDRMKRNMAHHDILDDMVLAYNEDHLLEAGSKQ